MEPIGISSHNDLTNSFIMDMIDEHLYEMTKAFELYNDKHTFCEKITDKYTRYMMLKPLVIITSKNIFHSTFGKGGAKS